MREEGNASVSGGSEMSDSSVAMSSIALWSMKRRRKDEESTMVPERQKPVARWCSDDSELTDGIKVISLIKPGDGKKGGWFETVLILAP
jgi:hypothetical protein